MTVFGCPEICPQGLLHFTNHTVCNVLEVHVRHLKTHPLYQTPLPFYFYIKTTESSEKQEALTCTANWASSLIYVHSSVLFLL